MRAVSPTAEKMRQAPALRPDPVTPMAELVLDRASRKLPGSIRAALRDYAFAVAEAAPIAFQHGPELAGPGRDQRCTSYVFTGDRCLGMVMLLEWARGSALTRSVARPFARILNDRLGWIVAEPPADDDIAGDAPTVGAELLRLAGELARELVLALRDHAIDRGERPSLRRIVDLMKRALARFEAELSRADAEERQ